MTIKYRPLYVKKPRKKNMYDFVKSLIAYKGGYGRLLFIETYNDKKFTIKEDICRRRSFNDIYCIVKTQYKSLTKLKLHKLLKRLHEDEDVNLNFYYCTAIDKVVFRAWYQHYELGKANMSLCTPNKKGNGIYSMQEIIDIWKEI